MKKYTFYLVGLVVLALSSCNKNKLYYPADFYQGTMQTCIDKNNIYVDIHRTFPHINTNSIFYYDNFPAEHLIEYNFATNKMDTLFSPKSSNFSPTYYPSDFYIVKRDTLYHASDEEVLDLTNIIFQEYSSDTNYCQELINLRIEE